MSLPVHFAGHGDFVLVTDDSQIGTETEGALAPLEHCVESEDLDLTFGNMLFNTSYAHLYKTGEIKRYGAVIGFRDDLSIRARRFGQ